MRRAQEQIEGEMDKLRGLIADLRPAALDELGLEASVRDLAERTQVVYGIEVDSSLELHDSDGRAAAPGARGRDDRLPHRSGVPQQRRAARGRLAGARSRSRSETARCRCG